MIEDCVEDFWFGDLTIEGARGEAVAEEPDAVHLGLGEAAPVVDAPFLIDVYFRHLADRIDDESIWLKGQFVAMYS